MADFEIKINHNVLLVEKLQAAADSNTVTLMSLQAEKMETAELMPFLDKVKEQMRTMERANNDNFAQLMATDNYVEKYLPFKV
jgi:hypothetical protein